MPMMSMPRNRPRPEPESPDAPPAQRRRLDDDDAAASSAAAATEDLNSASVDGTTAAPLERSPSPGDTVRSSIPPMRLPPLPRIKRPDHIPWYWRIETLNTQPPLNVARLSRQGHSGAQATDGLLEALSIALWDRGLSVPYLRRIALEQVVRGMHEPAFNSYLENRAEEEEEDLWDLNDFADDLSRGHGVEVAMWALEKALHVRIFILYGDDEYETAFDASWERPLKGRSSRPGNIPHIGLYRASPAEWQLILPD